MVEEEPFFFFLPSLFTKHLVKDDRDNYSFVSYQRNVISDATRIVVKDFSTHINKLDTSSKKRIKTISEYLAVALSLPTQEIPLMNTAEMIYNNWLNNLSIFGSPELQNRFLRQIFKHLSLPFAFRQPSSQEVSDGSFYSLLNSIITDYKASHIRSGSIFEKETWITLLNVVLGITDEVFEFDLENTFSKSDSSKIRQKLVDLCFSIIQLSGISDEDVWTNFKTYCSKWNHHLDFVRIWGQHLIVLFTNLNTIAYKRKKSLVLCGGVYSIDNPISDKMVKFLFFNTLSLIEVKIILENVLLMNKFSQTMAELILKSESIIGSLDSYFLLKRKYPSDTFLKLFGPLLTFLPSLDDRYDESISLIIGCILTIISDFEIDYSSENVKRLISYCVKNTQPNNMRTITSFLKRGSFAFSHNNDILPYISQKALSFIKQLYSANSHEMFIDESLIGYITSIYMSSSEMLRFNPSSIDSISNSYQLIWKNNNIKHINYQLLNFAYSYDDILPLIEKVSESINLINSTDIDVTYLSSCILLIGTYIRFSSMNSSRSPEILSSAVKALIQNQIIPRVFTALMKFEYNTKIEEFADMIFSSQQMLTNILEYAPQILDLEENRSIICQFINFIELLTPKSGHSSQLSKQFWNKIYTKNINPMNDLISLQIATFFPSKDHFSRRLNSCFEINENSIINKFNITDPCVNYFSIGQEVLISFIESKAPENDFNKDSYIFIRGQYGKSIFQVRDSTLDEFKDERKPKLSNEIQYTQTSAGSERVDDNVLDNELFTIDIVPTLSMEDLQSIDDCAMLDYKGQYEEQLDWNKYGFYEPFDQPGQQQIPLASRFVSSMGLARSNNASEIRFYTNKSDEESTELQATIKKLDEIDSLPLLPAVVHHILPCDAYECKCDLSNYCSNNYNTNDSLNISTNHTMDNFNSNLLSTDENEYESYDINNIDINNENEMYYFCLDNDYDKFKDQIVFNPRKHPKRMTPAFLRFLKEIGEPMQISEELHILPPLRSTVPVIPSFHSFIPIISPAMAIDEKDAQTIFNIGETSAMKIIFNETDFDIRPPIYEKNLKQFVISISPRTKETGPDSYNLYNVTQLIVPNGIYSPFNERQNLTAKTIAFNIANIYEQTIKLNSLLLPTSAQKARKTMSQLTQKNIDTSILGTISEQFTF